MLKAPPNSGTVYNNYKGFFSIILLDLVNADYKFLWVEVGANGSTSDCAAYNQSQFKDKLEKGPLAFHLPHHFPVTTQPFHTS